VTNLIVSRALARKRWRTAAVLDAQSQCNGRFLAVNCAPIPGGLVESELFGHERDAFTSASARRLGIFERANGGIVFLDEITEMKPDLQPKLLRSDLRR
jgi:transcriptional regulator with GAF, ATPase, and Fis domain